MRIVGLGLAVLAIVFAVSANVPPLRVDCPTSGMTVEACHETVDATLRRGLVVPHPLILAAHVVPGPAGPTANGHRATVTYDLLGMPDPTVIELPDRSVIRSVQFDTGLVETDGRLAKRMLVEMSDTSATEGFKPIADVTLSSAVLLLSAPSDRTSRLRCPSVPATWTPWITPS